MEASISGFLRITPDRV